MNIRKFDNIGETLYTDTLDNGLRVLYVRKPDFRMSYAVIAVKYGGAYRRFLVGDKWHDTPAGVAHFLEHKLFDMPDGSDALTALSENGASPNAFTSCGMTAYHFDCTESFEKNLKTLAGFVTTPYFTPDSVAKEQGIIAQEIGMFDDRPPFVVYNRLIRMLYAKHPIRDQVAGTVSSIAEITDKTLYDCYNAFYRPSNMVLCAAGSIEPERFFFLAHELLNSLPDGEIPQPDFGETGVSAPLETYHEERMELSAPQFLIGCALDFPLSGKALQRRMIVGMLALRTLFGTSGDFYNRLYGEGLLNRDYDYEIDCTAGTATFMLGGESPDPKRVLKELCDALSEVKVKGLSPNAFERAKKASFGARLRGLEDFDNLCIALTESALSDYCSLDSFSLLSEITVGEREEFLIQNIDPDRLALSVLLPNEVTK